MNSEQSDPFQGARRMKKISAQNTYELEKALAMTQLEMQRSGLHPHDVAARSLVYVMATAFLEETPESQQNALGGMLSFAVMMAREMWKRRGDDVPLMTIEERAQDGDTPQQIRRVEESDEPAGGI
jgi:hypothetical protein